MKGSTKNSNNNNSEVKKARATTRTALIIKSPALGIIMIISLLQRQQQLWIFNKNLLKIPSTKLPTPSITPKSPCFVHSYLNDSLLSTPLSEIITRCDNNEPTDYSELAETAVGTVMIVTKPGDDKLIGLTRELAMHLISTPRFGKDHGVTVYVDKSLKDMKKFDFEEMLKTSHLAKDYLKFWTNELCGDGTVLYTSWLFQKVVPPVLPFHLGSLGFLTNFDFQDYKNHLTNVMEKGIRVNLRMRFTCTKSIHEHSLTFQPSETFEILNDLVVDRGAGPYMSLLELFGDDEHLTTVQADGLVISTPTGSTAYSVSAGGSLVHPEISALLMTPICPHTLSFRPMLLPDSMELKIYVPFNSRNTSWASFDGRNRVELKQGDYIKVTPSKFPFPTVCLKSQSQDWFTSISRCLKWNERELQKGFVVVEEEETSSDEDEKDNNKVKFYDREQFKESFNNSNNDNQINIINDDKNNDNDFIFSINDNDNEPTKIDKNNEKNYYSSSTTTIVLANNSTNINNEEEWKVVTRGRNGRNGRNKKKMI
ncbi:18349_t:CDS:2 [Entrophospora sp. SA101]|nr:2289_t:CDS:2 [Entrophospora sp. SA101]CAJ0751338.1 18349_t:CDS:2 [Entrophospora sp. SA101]CAJ0835323.1 2522_t:CDS:2 [Entrophospora sp. SA101]